MGTTLPNDGLKETVVELCILGFFIAIADGFAGSKCLVKPVRPSRPRAGKDATTRGQSRRHKRIGFIIPITKITAKQVGKNDVHFLGSKIGAAAHTASALIALPVKKSASTILDSPTKG